MTRFRSCAGAKFTFETKLGSLDILDRAEELAAAERNDLLEALPRAPDRGQIICGSNAHDGRSSPWTSVAMF